MSVLGFAQQLSWSSSIGQKNLDNLVLTDLTKVSSILSELEGCFAWQVVFVERVGGVEPSQPMKFFLNVHDSPFFAVVRKVFVVEI